MTADFKNIDLFMSEKLIVADDAELKQQLSQRKWNKKDVLVVFYADGYSQKKITEKLSLQNVQLFVIDMCRVWLCDQNLADQFGRSPSNRELYRVLHDDNIDSLHVENVQPYGANQLSTGDVSSTERKRKTEDVMAVKNNDHEAVAIQRQIAEPLQICVEPL
ncbi:hypothetical protein L6452_09188 [Arctium lappa]|uniref:Uncharacterized protein n=1 Tax=Arctium lappa TaxID=4217 RepID=A0ACB9DJD1_ARCLA|nr:hypothetical protein L6452_09188 [Arctium lappa]